MSRIKNRNTRPELEVRSALHKLGYRFRLNCRELPGRPDIVLPKYKAVILVHGCFWHRHRRCRYAYNPKSNLTFWKLKFQANTDRDSMTVKKLKNSGWRVYVIWECQALSTDKLQSRLNVIERRLQVKTPL